MVFLYLQTGFRRWLGSHTVAKNTLFHFLNLSLSSPFLTLPGGDYLSSARLCFSISSPSVSLSLSLLSWMESLNYRLELFWQAVEWPPLKARGKQFTPRYRTHIPKHTHAHLHTNVHSGSQEWNVTSGQSVVKFVRSRVRRKHFELKKKGC